MQKNLSCLACGYSVHYPVYHPEDQPLAALSLPKTQQDAVSAARLPMNFYACAYCGHIHNVDFDYSKVPYQEDSNLMYNSGSGWQVYIQELIARLHQKYDFSGKTVLEIGCGDGHFLTRLKSVIPSLRCIGFEPGIDTQRMKDKTLEVHNDYFVAQRDIERFKPDLILCRHVIEHLSAPRDFVAEISYWCNLLGHFPYLLAEVPCIDVAVAQSRVNDYLYEHVSNFTRTSFRTMFERAGFEVLEYDTAYADEVLVALLKPALMPELAERKAAMGQYRQALVTQNETVRHTLASWQKSGKKLVFWGGTGKGAAFLNAFGLDHRHYPVVVDSDMLKVGRFVPGMGQEIRSPEYVKEHPVDVIVITTQWRARDICEEIQRRNIRGCEIYVVRDQTLVKL